MMRSNWGQVPNIKLSVPYFSSVDNLLRTLQRITFIYEAAHRIIFFMQTFFIRLIYLWYLRNRRWKMNFILTKTFKCISIYPLSYHAIIAFDTCCIIFWDLVSDKSNTFNYWTLESVVKVMTTMKIPYRHILGKWKIDSKYFCKLAEFAFLWI